MDAKLDRIESRLANLEVDSRAAWKCLGQKLDSLLGDPERALAETDDISTGLKLDGKVPGYDSMMERKRLKERLKDAAAAHDEIVPTNSPEGPPPLAERIFGIRSADARAGKERSRSPRRFNAIPAVCIR